MLLDKLHKTSISYLNSSTHTFAAASSTEQKQLKIKKGGKNWD